MPNKMMPDTPAPDLSLPLVGGGTFTLAEQQPETFTMLLFYRGYHCPVCKTYLGELNGLMHKAEESGLTVVAASMDGEDRAAKAKSEWGLDRVQVAYGLSLEAAQEWGLYISSSIKDAETERFAEPGLFWVRPNGRLYLIDVTNMPFARPDLEILLPKAKFATDNAYPARGTFSG